MKKVFVILPNGNGRAERQSVRIASYLPAGRFRVEYVIVGPSADKVGELIPDGAKLHPIRLGHIWQGGIFRIWQLFRREKPDVVLSSFHYLNGCCVLASRLAGIPRSVIRGNMSAIGDGDPLGRFLNSMYYRKASAVIEDCGLGDAVHFAGYQRNPVPWVLFADCFVLSSRWEGLPNALIEAQYLGVPAVATNCIASMSRVVKEGVNGYIVPVDDECALAEAMEKALSLKHVAYTYQSASPEDFVNCFE